MRRRTTILGGLLLAAGCATGCGSDTTTPDPTDAGVVPLIPVAAGNTWTYRVTEGTEVSTKVQTITGPATSNGREGFQFVTTKGTTREVESVQALVDGVLVRLEEKNYKNGALNEWDVYEPSMVRIDSNQADPGDEYQTTHTKVSMDVDTGTVAARIVVENRFSVQALESIDVPAGRFTALRVLRIDATDQSRKLYWYVPGLGKVREVGGQTEELESVSLVE